MVSSKAERIHKNAIIVEGHRDLFEMVRLSDQGHVHPLVEVTYPRLKRLSAARRRCAALVDQMGAGRSRSGRAP